MELARALALQTLAMTRDAVIEDLPERQRAIAETVWPQSPLSGYGLHSSLGAFVASRVAIGWAPSGHTGHRHEPLDRQGILSALEEDGVDRSVGTAVLGDWQRVSRDFVPSPAGLDASRIAGLAECALSREERARALSEAAYSGRCLTRLGSAIAVLSQIRTVLPVLAPQSLGARFCAAMAALALDRPDRALALVGALPEALGERTLAEIAEAMIVLGRGQLPSLEDDGFLATPGVERDAEEDAKTPLEAPGSDDSVSAFENREADHSEPDDVLEIIEERIAPPEEERAAVPLDPIERDGVVRPPRWGEAAPEDEDGAAVAEWRKRLDETGGLVARRGGLLGLRLPAPARTVLPIALPPELRLAKHGAQLAGWPFDALFPPVRGVLRSIVLAAEGRGPSLDALGRAGDLAWVLHRARALALIAKGDLKGAREAVGTLSEEASPEGQWAKDRLLRYGSRREVRAKPEEVRLVAANLIADLCHQLGRTIAGTVPSGAGVERLP